MELTETDIKQFQGLYLSNFGLQLDRKTARKKLLLMVRQMELVYRPITKKQFENLKDVNGDEDAKADTSG